MNTTLQNTAATAGRILPGLLFVVSGIGPGEWSVDRR